MSLQTVMNALKGLRTCNGNGEAEASKVLTVNTTVRNVSCKRHAALQASAWHHIRLSQELNRPINILRQVSV